MAILSFLGIYTAVHRFGEGGGGLFIGNFLKICKIVKSEY